MLGFFIFFIDGVFSLLEIEHFKVRIKKFLNFFSIRKFMKKLVFLFISALFSISVGNFTMIFDKWYLFTFNFCSVKKKLFLSFKGDIEFLRMSLHPLTSSLFWCTKQEENWEVYKELGFKFWYRIFYRNKSLCFNPFRLNAFHNHNLSLNSSTSTSMDWPLQLSPLNSSPLKKRRTMRNPLNISREGIPEAHTGSILPQKRKRSLRGYCLIYIDFKRRILEGHCRRNSDSKTEPY